MKSDIQQRYLSIITEYVVDVSYIRGEDNIVADCLSRPVCAVTIDPCDLPAISESQKTDEELKTYESQLKTYEIQGSSIWCDLSTSTPDPTYLNHYARGSLTCSTTSHIQDLHQQPK